MITELVALSTLELTGAVFTWIMARHRLWSPAAIGLGFTGIVILAIIQTLLKGS